MIRTLRANNRNGLTVDDALILGSARVDWQAISLRR